MNPAEAELPFVPQSFGDCPSSRFSPIPRTLHKGSKSSSSQSTTNVNTDNSAVVGDYGINATDGATALRDNAIALEGSNNTVNVQTLDAKVTSGVLELAGGVAIESADLIRSTTDDAFDFGTSTVQESLDANRDITGDALAFADEANFRALESNNRALEANRDVTADAFNFSDNTNSRALSSVDNALEGAFAFGEEINSSALKEVGETNETLARTLDKAFEFARISQDSANQTSQAANTVLAQKSQDAPSAISETLQKNVLIGIGIIASALIVSRLPSR